MKCHVGVAAAPSAFSLRTDFSDSRRLDTCRNRRSIVPAFTVQRAVKNRIITAVISSCKCGSTGKFVAAPLGSSTQPGQVAFSGARSPHFSPQSSPSLAAARRRHVAARAGLDDTYWISVLQAVGVAVGTGGVGVVVGLLLRFKLWNDAKKEVARLRAEGRLEEEVASVLQQMAKQEGREGRRQVQAEQVLKTSVDDDADGAAAGSESKGAAGGVGGEEVGIGKGEDVIVRAAGMAPVALAAGTAHRRRKWPEARPLVSGRVTRKALVLIKELKTKPPANEDELHQRLENWVKGVRPHRRDLIDTIKEMDTADTRELLCQVMQWSLSEEWYEADARDYTKLVERFGKDGRLGEMERAFTGMEADGIAPDLISFSVKINAYGRAKQVEKAEAAWEEMRLRGITPDAKAFTTMMTVYGKAGQPDKAEQLLDAMLAAACKPSPVTLCSLVTAFGLAGRPDDAQRVFDKVLAQTDIKPDCHTYTALSAAFGLNGRTDEAVAAFKRMLAAGLAPDDRSVARLVEAHGSMERQLDRQLALLAGKGAEGGADGGDVQAEERRGETEQEGEEGRRRGEEGAGVGKRREASEEEKLRCRQAVKLVLELEGAGIRPGVETYTALISLFASHGLVREAAEVFEEMQRVGLQPNARTYTRLFQAYALAGDLDSCSQVRKTMQVLGWTLNPPIVRGMVRALVAGGQGAAAAELVREAEEEEGVAVDGDVKEMAHMHARELVL
ncbi:unnamed protein product [Closterium sp. Yama58-4]|nr:unnamed protein product [Closterium sp. Yama58-4]